MNVLEAHRLAQLPPYLFLSVDRRKREALDAGRDVIDLGVGDPDLATPRFIVDSLAEVVRDPLNHAYAPGAGIAEFRQAAAEFFARRFAVTLDPETEVLSLLGSKEGIGHLPLAIVNPGESVLIPQPGYPVYAGATVLAGGSCYPLPLCERNDWLPVLGDIPLDVRRAARLVYLNYPNNPTAACAPLSFFEEVVAFAREYGILIAHDAAYSGVYFAEPPPSILQVDGAKEVAVEFHSFSKTFNMSGWRLAFAVGNPAALAALARVKDNVDSGVFRAIQLAGIEAIRGIDRVEVREQRAVYRRRRDILVDGLRGAGWSVATPRATFFVWAKCPGGQDSMAMVSRMLDECDVVAIPGAGFGPHGEGFVRFALTVGEERIGAAAERIGRVTWQPDT